MDAQRNITDMIYKALFGMSLNKLVNRAIKRTSIASYQAALVLHNSDEDEAIRDFFSIEALQALNSLEGDCGTYILQLVAMDGMTPTIFIQALEDFIKDGATVIKAKYEGGKIPLWYNEGNSHDKA